MSYPWQFTSMSARVRQVIASGGLGAIQYISNTFSSAPLYLYQGDDRTADPDVTASYPAHGPGGCHSDPTRSGGGQAICR